MELSEAFEKRRSIRSYDPTRKVDIAQLRQLIEAAEEAPSWKNTLTGRYHVVTGSEMLAQLRACLQSQNPQRVEGASALIVTSFRKNISGFERSGEPSTELGNEWGAYDLGLQNAFLLLKATELGLDTLVMGLRDAEKIRQLLSIPEDETIVAVIAVGHRAEDPIKPRRKELEKIATFYE